MRVGPISQNERALIAFFTISIMMLLLTASVFVHSRSSASEAASWTADLADLAGDLDELGMHIATHRLASIDLNSAGPGSADINDRILDSVVEVAVDAAAIDPLAFPAGASERLEDVRTRASAIAKSRVVPSFDNSGLLIKEIHRLALSLITTVDADSSTLLVATRLATLDLYDSIERLFYAAAVAEAAGDTAPRVRDDALQDLRQRADRVAGLLPMSAELIDGLDRGDNEGAPTEAVVTDIDGFLSLITPGVDQPADWMAQGGTALSEFRLAIGAFAAGASDAGAKEADRLRGQALLAMAVVVVMVGLLVGAGLVVRAERRRRVVLEDELRHLASHDELTGLLNRRGLDHLVFDERAAVDEQTHLCVFSVDLDKFKSINNTFGHAAGDAVLVATSERLKSATRDGDEVLRLGGDEFLIIVPMTGHLDDVMRLGARIVSELGQPHTWNDHTFVVGASVGIAMSDGSSNADDLVARADAALCRAKGRGPNQVVIAESAAEVSASR